jgi:cytochrome d ubiquinol oxidase subunit II
MTMGELWYWLLAALIIAYVVLDGFDLGAGAVLALVAKTEKERALVVRSVGPVWDGNEVCLLAAGGTLVLAFPRVYASAFQGFYLPLMMVLWLLTFRALAIELRHHLESRAWILFFDFSFGIASALLAVFLGAALGNVVRGVELDGDGHFFLGMATNFSGHPPFGVLDWFTTLTGVTALAVLARHGALWLHWRTTGAVAERSGRLARRLTLACLILGAGLSAATFWIQPLALQNLESTRVLVLFPLLATLGLAGSHVALVRKKEGLAFTGSAIFLAGLLLCAAGGLFPTLLPSSGPGAALTAANATSSDYALRTDLCWWVPGVLLAGVYFTVLYMNVPKKFRE